MPHIRQPQQVSRLESIAQIVALSVLFFSIPLLFGTPALLFGPASTTYQLDPIWQQVTLPFLVIFAVFFAQAVVNLFRPDWMRFRLAVRLAANVAMLGIIIFLLRANQWVVLAHSNDGSGNAIKSINQYVYLGLWSLAIAAFVSMLINVWQLVRHKQKTTA